MLLNKTITIKLEWSLEILTPSRIVSQSESSPNRADGRTGRFLMKFIGATQQKNGLERLVVRRTQRGKCHGLTECDLHNRHSFHVPLFMNLNSSVAF